MASIANNTVGTIDDGSFQVVGEDQDSLWRCFSLYCLQGSAMESLQLRSHSFVKFIRDCQVPKKFRMDDASVTLIYRRYASGNPRLKSTSTRLLNSQKKVLYLQRS